MHADNSDVLWSGSMAVDVTTHPYGSAAPMFTVKLPLPIAFVVTLLSPT